MDTTQTTDCVEFCFGYGGNHLGLKRIIRNLHCIAASEIEAYAVANMVAKMEAGFMDPFPVWTDLRTFPCEQFHGLVDILIASYPCQPFSSAGQRKGADDPRHLWPFVRRAVEIIRPRYCFFENVEGHVSLGLREVLTELALLGYRVENSRGEPTWGIFSAAEVGAPHNRKRVFILAEDRQVDNAMREQNDWHNTVRLHRSFVRASQELAVTNTGGHIHEQSRIEPAKGRIDAQRDLAAACGKVKELGNTSIVRRSAIREGTGEDCIGEETRQDGRVREPSGASPPQGLEKPERSGSGASRPDEIASGQSGQPCEPSVAFCASARRTEGDSNSGRSRKGKGAKKERRGLADRNPHVGVGQTDSDIARPQGRDSEELPECSGKGIAWTQSPFYWPGFVARPNEEQKQFEPPRIIGVKRGLGGGVNGRASNVDRLRLLGNGVYPAAAAKAFFTLYKRLIT